ncbi:MAG: hypothetical protein LBT53_05270 [Puniceicoccales bacterium]|jgi:hypothetical protein|nr:hypothetical protein [Puniceicoccales bacterium]
MASPEFEKQLADWREYMKTTPISEPFDLEKHKAKMKALDASHRGFPWGTVILGASLALLGWTILHNPRKSA